MMNYDEMSDFKINRKVSWLVFGENSIVKRCPASRNSVIIHGRAGEFDPCSNPSDAWPIIVASNISIIRTSKGWMATWSEYGAHMAVNDIYATHEKPFVAAMICFLKMKDAENAN